MLSLPLFLLLVSTVQPTAGKYVCMYALAADNTTDKGEIGGVCGGQKSLEHEMQQSVSVSMEGEQVIQ